MCAEGPKGKDSNVTRACSIHKRFAGNLCLYCWRAAQILMQTQGLSFLALRAIMPQDPLLARGSRNTHYQVTSSPVRETQRLLTQGEACKVKILTRFMWCIEYSFLILFLEALSRSRDNAKFPDTFKCVSKYEPLDKNRYFLKCISSFQSFPSDPQLLTPSVTSRGLILNRQDGQGGGKQNQTIIKIVQDQVSVWPFFMSWKFPEKPVVTAHSGLVHLFSRYLLTNSGYLLQLVFNL